ncbi:3-oxo-Delta(4,5)-steroid 5-beta-reductase-like [Hibiscus syriacus]|uniref:3-oxo-Delta(4,5)-steroid 5-beta-reductase-like n=1 Tax=Hibiscus syriacus TaxID=106335 RepID=UPI001922A5FF|nr:3-oxo-Delta(4,5)-steroid 5-beta-reductase-like [Hibiscus syriacus]
MVFLPYDTQSNYPLTKASAGGGLALLALLGQQLEERETPRGFQSVALVIGATGIVGNSLAEILPLSDTLDVNNGDVFKWKHLWKTLAEQFGIEKYGFEEGKNLGLEKIMKGKEKVWEEMVKVKQLQKTRLEEVAAWWFVI